MAIYGEYDQVGLDTQYNLRARVPSFMHHFARWAETSAAARGAAPCRLDLAYGDEPMARLDLFPAPQPDAPCLVFVHGGYWQSLDKSDFSFLAPPLQARGIAVALVNYALAPAAAMDGIVRQCREAVAWLWRNAGGLGLDPGRLHVAGHSAGGHLTAMVMATDWRQFGLAADPVAGGCAVSGVYDLEPIRLSYLNAVLGLDEAAARRNGPVHLAPPPGRPLILALGGKETDEFHRQQADFAAAWRERGGSATEMVLPGEDHFTVVGELAAAESPLHAALIGQISGGQRSDGAPRR